MSRAGEITLQFGSEERLFRLGIGEWRRIQERCDAGPFEIHSRLMSALIASSKGLSTFEGILLAGQSKLRIDDYRQVLYEGLIGAGIMKPDEAGRLIVELVDQRPIGEAVGIACRVVTASLAGASDEAPGEFAGAPADESQSPSREVN